MLVKCHQMAFLAGAQKHDDWCAVIRFLQNSPITSTGALCKALLPNTIKIFPSIFLESLAFNFLSPPAISLPMNNLGNSVTSCWDFRNIYQTASLGAVFSSLPLLPTHAFGEFFFATTKFSMIQSNQSNSIEQSRMFQCFYIYDVGNNHGITLAMLVNLRYPQLRGGENIFWTHLTEKKAYTWPKIWGYIVY